MKKFLFSFIILLVAVSSQAAITDDGVAQSAQTTGAATLSWSHTCAGTNRVLFVGVGTSSSTTALTSTVELNASTTGWVEMWDVALAGTVHDSGHYLLACTVMVNTVRVTVAAAQDEFVGISHSMNGVSQSSPIGAVPTTANGASTTATTNTITSAVGEVILSMLYDLWNGATAGGTAVEIDEEIIGAQVSGTAFKQAGSGGTNTVTATRTAVGFSTEWIINAVSFKPAASGAATPWMSLRGVGP